MCVLPWLQGECTGDGEACLQAWYLSLHVCYRGYRRSVGVMERRVYRPGIYPYMCVTVVTGDGEACLQAWYLSLHVCVLP